MKIALVGTHGVSKTTLAYELAGILKRRGKTVELLTEIARDAPSLSMSLQLEMPTSGLSRVRYNSKLRRSTGRTYSFAIARFSTTLLTTFDATGETLLRPRRYLPTATRG